MENIVELIKALAWPLTVFFLVLILRNQITGVFSRLSHLKYKDLEAKFEFEKDLDKAEEKSSSLPVLTEEQLGYKDENYERLLEIAKFSPRAAILEAWIEVERAVMMLVQDLGLKGLHRVPTYRALRTLVEREVVPIDISALYQDLRVLRNQAAHEEDFRPNMRQTERYLSLTLQLAAAIQALQTTGKVDNEK